jgi:DNA mismatch repair protein MutL
MTAPSIAILPHVIASQIAAGEVVERPSSIVKELVENSIDAGARKISVAVEAGGRKLIRVTDDGVGMVPEDARLAFHRHATSKISGPDDLFAIDTLGFRGEALASIASVARVRLETQSDAATVGTELEIAGGDVDAVREGAFPRGTQVTVEDVFYNVPARRKFLRSDTWELGQITTHCTRFALAFPEIHFVLTSGGFEVLAVPPAGSHRERVFQLFGGELLEDLVEFERTGRGGLGVHVFTSRPQVQKHNRNSMFFFVNRRAVRDRSIAHAFSEAYRNILPSGTFPVSVLFLKARPEDIDVNVHPAKTEIRFRNGSMVHDAVRETVSEGLRSDRTIIPMSSESRGMSAWAAPALGGRVPDSWKEGSYSGSETAGGPSPLSAGWAGTENRELSFPEADSFVGAGPDGVTPDFELVRRDLRPLGQLRDSFIVAVDLTGLVLIDQHVAHERVLFENYMKAHEDGDLDVQRLLTPVVVELAPAQQAVFDRIGSELARCGFETFPFGPRTISITTAPSILKPSGVEQLLRELLDGIDPGEREIDLQTFQRKIAATVSCHAAIKINNPLDSVKMQWLVGELMRTDCPTVCPHGRPIIVRYDLREIQKAFKRV